MQLKGIRLHEKYVIAPSADKLLLDAAYLMTRTNNESTRPRQRAAERQQKVAPGERAQRA